MIITFHGGSALRFQTGEMVIGVNPSLPPHGSKVSKFGSELVISSSFRPEHYSVDQMTHGDEEPFEVNGPGAYEYHGYTIKGEQLGKSSGNQDQSTTVFSFEMDDIKVTVLGSIVRIDELNPDTSEVFAETDILVIPIDSERPQDIQNMINFIDPKVIIPVNFWSLGDMGIKEFLSTQGQSSLAPEDKITIKKKECDQMSKKIILLSI